MLTKISNLAQFCDNQSVRKNPSKQLSKPIINIQSQEMIDYDTCLQSSKEFSKKLISKHPKILTNLEWLLNELKLMRITMSGRENIA